MSELGAMERIARECLSDSRRWFPEVAQSMPFMTLALAGEVGEFANLVKKVERGSLNIKDVETRNKLTMEATDILIYLMNIFALLQADPERSYRYVRTLNERRFGANAIQPNGGAQVAK